MRSVFRYLVAALAGLALLPHSGFAKLADDEVAIVDGGDLSSWQYSPSTLTVSAGTTVTWRNSGSQAHSITSQDQLFDSKLLDSGRSWSYTFHTPGSYRFFCVPHPWMKGVVLVAPADDRGNRRADNEAARDGDRDRRVDDSSRDGDSSRDNDASRDGERSSGRDEPTPTPTPTSSRDEPTSSPTPTRAPTASPTPSPTPTSGTSGG